MSYLETMNSPLPWDCRDPGERLENTEYPINDKGYLVINTHAPGLKRHDIKIRYF